jgi:cyclopropane-fatty-acyl-phospholipid synthase
MTLEEAQRSRLARLLELAAPRDGHDVLEIGSGWGGFAIAAARAVACRVTGLTLSTEQLRLAGERAAAAGVGDRVAFELCDYRRARGAYDRIVSIEMLEAVGHENLGAYFAACDRLLKPGGRVLLQVITIPDQRYECYRRNPDWIQKHIFPGGHLPSLGVLCRAMAACSTLGVERVENIGPHYAPTLRAWRERFEARRDELERLGYDPRFQRKWRYYLHYCEAAFAERLLNDLLIVLARPGEEPA